MHEWDTVRIAPPVRGAGKGEKSSADTGEENSRGTEQISWDGMQIDKVREGMCHQRNSTQKIATKRGGNVKNYQEIVEREREREKKKHR